MASERSFDVDIPLDITVEILKKLPAKSIARFDAYRSKGYMVKFSCRRLDCDSVFDSTTA